jgi:hypothetical protein
MKVHLFQELLSLSQCSTTSFVALRARKGNPRI